MTKHKTGWREAKENKYKVRLAGLVDVVYTAMLVAAFTTLVLAYYMAVIERGL